MIKDERVPKIMKLCGGEFCGEILKRNEFPGFRVLESRYRPHSQLPKHSHECARFSLLLQGRYTELSSKKSWHWKPFNFGFNISDEVHKGIVDKTGAQFFIIEVDAEWLRCALGRSAIPDRTTIFPEAAVTCLVARLYTEVRQPDRISPIAIEGIALELIAHGARSHNQGHCAPRWLKQAEEIIHARFTETLSLNAIAETVGVHPVHLARVFRKHHRSTIGDYVRHLRVQFACQQLATPEVGFSQVALAAGFYDQAHLTRIFKRQLGMTPSQYRSIVCRR
jgi:AraC family transcriptional regulator